MSKTQDTRKLIQFLTQPDTMRCIKQWYAADGCRSRNEFIERAVMYYADTIAAADNTLLLRAISAAIDGRLSQFENRLSRLSYKTAVELDMHNGLLADAFNVSEDDLRRRRAESVQNVKRTNP